MKKLADSSASPATLRAFAEGDVDTASRLFCRLCRAAPALREWLWEEFARKPKVRSRLAAVLEKEESDEEAALFLPDNHSLRIEAAALREKVPARLYGGLTWGEVEELVRHYQAGKLDLGTFLLVNEWKLASGESPPSPRLMLHSAEWFARVVHSGDTALVRHVGKTLRFLASLEKAPQRRGVFGHTDWWKLNVLFFILRHPRESYRTRELRAHLEDLGIEVSAKDVRRFCTRHGIRRDMRAGRPRTRS